MDQLALLVPSRERPHNIARLIAAMDETSGGVADLIVGVDQDDPYLADYRQLDCEVVVKPRIPLVGWLNHLASEYVDKYRFLGHIGDDNVPRTAGWDTRIVESLERQGEIGFCFGNDLDPGRPPGSLSIHIFMTSEVVRRLGYFGPPQIQHMYVDPVWFAWGTATSIDFLSDVELPHLHYSLGHAPQDESYRRSTGLIPRDCAAYNDYCDTQMNADIRKLGGTPFTPEAMAEFNARLNIPRQM